VELPDVKKAGFIARGDILMLFRSVMDELLARNLLTGFLDPEDVCDEIFDLISPANPNQISLDDLMISPHTRIVIGILTDATDFWTYDNRENAMLLQQGPAPFQ
jgi:hypothetical protein